VKRVVNYLISKFGLHRITCLAGRVVAFQISDFVFYNPFAGQF
jgi:hypothetical protein